MAGVQAVTPCTDEDVRHAEQLKHHVVTADSPYANYSICTLNTNGWQGEPRSPGRTFKIGDPVTFCLEGYPERFFGRVRSMCDDESYSVELVGGARKVGLRDLSLCSEEDLERRYRSKQGWKTRKDPFAEGNTRNAPAWGGGSGYSSSYRERSPASRARSLGRSASIPSLIPSTCASELFDGRRSLSPQPLRRRPSGASDRSELATGCPVYFFLEGHLKPLFGRVLSAEEDGTFTVDVVGGRRLVGLREIVACGEDELEKARNLKQPVVTRKDSYAELNTRNGPPQRSLSPTPCLRGVAINLPPRSATRINAP